MSKVKMKTCVTELTFPLHTRKKDLGYWKTKLIIFTSWSVCYPLQYTYLQKLSLHSVSNVNAFKWIQTSSARGHRQSRGQCQQRWRQMSDREVSAKQ